MALKKFEADDNKIVDGSNRIETIPNNRKSGRSIIALPQYLRANQLNNPKTYLQS